MRNYYIVIIALFLLGCGSAQKKDGLYIDHKLIKEDATIEDFCKAKDKGRIGLWEDNKEIRSFEKERAGEE